MQVKTFTGKNTKQALDKVKEELGLDAVILGSREVVIDGQRLIEVTAGADEKAELQLPHESMTVANAGDWHKEWDRIKGHIYSLLEPSMRWDLLTQHQKVALEYLQREGVEQEVIVEIYNALLKANQQGDDQKSEQKAMLGVLASFVGVKSFNLKNYPQKIQVMAGPYGSGKTSVALRLAMLRKAERQNISIGFINTDSLRGNGRLVLRHWADLSGFPYFEAPDAEAMQAALTACKDLHCVFIDMEGLGRYEKLEDRLLDLGLNNYQIMVHLVLSPYYSNLKDVLLRYRTNFPTSLIWTKIDEANQYAQLVNVAVESKLPISAISFGAALQGSLVPAEESQIWKLILKHQLPAMEY